MRTSSTPKAVTIEGVSSNTISPGSAYSSKPEASLPNKLSPPVPHSGGTTTNIFVIVTQDGSIGRGTGRIASTFRVVPPGHA